MFFYYIIGMVSVKSGRNGGASVAKDVPAQKKAEEEGTRFQAEDGYQERPQGFKKAQAQGQKRAFGLKPA